MNHTCGYHFAIPVGWTLLVIVPFLTYLYRLFRNSYKLYIVLVPTLASTLIVLRYVIDTVVPLFSVRNSYK